MFLRSVNVQDLNKSSCGVTLTLHYPVKIFLLKCCFFHPCSSVWFKTVLRSSLQILLERITAEVGKLCNFMYLLNGMNISESEAHNTVKSIFLTLHFFLLKVSLWLCGFPALNLEDHLKLFVCVSWFIINRKYISDRHCCFRCVWSCGPIQCYEHSACTGRCAFPQKLRQLLKNAFMFSNPAL